MLSSTALYGAGDDIRGYFAQISSSRSLYHGSPSNYARHHATHSPNLTKEVANVWTFFVHALRSHKTPLSVPQVLGVDFAFSVALSETFGESFFSNVRLACSRLARVLDFACNSTCNSTYANRPSAVHSAVSRAHRTQCWRRRTSGPSDQVMNDWSVRSQKTQTSKKSTTQVPAVWFWSSRLQVCFRRKTEQHS
ncbi:uncharacterized protein CC84DRAFT_194453 [Paraphaeosphaeria sporulosa]|uniref:Uncharacterized protein n=1 Tax=Paraphaeosphaeria sporulosa TaxID=1460663 RepID=A0A177C1A7_9PLEO|nr:uncharacterized protein CC84DRAFT_194453 [Paraphaeosphaeria sporulosa]OAG01423.1 hypothetical protein CC84DRAFT_194453 [Paraphaeosphaeria sporulosa]